MRILIQQDQGLFGNSVDLLVDFVCIETVIAREKNGP